MMIIYIKWITTSITINMVGPGDNEQIKQVLVNVNGQTGMAGVLRKYDVIFTENGMAFAVVVSGLRMALQAGAAGGFGVAGAAAAGAYSSNQKVREQFFGLSVKQIIGLNEKSFYVPYSDIVKINVKKGAFVGKMSLEMTEGKFHCEFTKDQLDVAFQAAQGTPTEKDG